MALFVYKYLFLVIYLSWYAGRQFLQHTDIMWYYGIYDILTFNETNSLVDTILGPHIFFRIDVCFVFDNGTVNMKTQFLVDTL